MIDGNWDCDEAKTTSDRHCQMMLIDTFNHTFLYLECKVDWEKQIEPEETPFREWQNSILEMWYHCSILCAMRWCFYFHICESPRITIHIYVSPWKELQPLHPNIAIFWNLWDTLILFRMGINKMNDVFEKAGRFIGLSQKWRKYLY